MYRINKKLFLFLIPLLLSSCIRDNNDDCGVYVQFIFDYNMEYADSFNPQVSNVDVLLFDEGGTLIKWKAAESRQLVNNNQMYLTDDLEYGTYKIFTIGGLSEHTRITTTKNEDPESGLTTLEDIIFLLNRESREVSHEFPHVWLGKPVEIKYEFNRAVYPVHLVRNSNRFNLTLQEIDVEEIKEKEIPPYTFEVVIPEGAVYRYDNQPLLKETVTYHPYSEIMVDQPENSSLARLNTMRLLNEEGYRLIIRQRENPDQIVWSCDLIDLLKNSRPPTRPDGSELPLQEYLDRQGDWNIELLYRDIIGADPDSAFQAVAIIVNGWILWLNEIEV